MTNPCHPVSVMVTGIACVFKGCNYVWRLGRRVYIVTDTSVGTAIKSSETRICPDCWNEQPMPLLFDEQAAVAAVISDKIRRGYVAGEVCRLANRGHVLATTQSAGGKRVAFVMR